MTNTRRKSLISTWSYKAVHGQKGPLVTMKLGSFGMATSHWYAVVALWFAPGAEEGHGTAQRARTYSTVWCQSRILLTGYKDTGSRRGSGLFTELFTAHYTDVTLSLIHI